MVVNLTHENFEEEIINSKTPVIIDFWASWCGPCQMMKPVFEDLSLEYKGKLKFAKLDTEENELLTMKFGIMGIPTLIILKNSKEVGRIVGFNTKENLRQKINEILY
ncbi:MAG: Thioredoxin [archaeon GW2011_AR13]|nr:MAG: Thioredoxin [archaeon GW2011_AR13]HIG95219.1 thioredoxin [Nanoarchaeota archaeon]HIH63100.1 thioredoxin [Nanoarchaeota archaeon]HIJ09155.1 thioredoxin [Nanoarchaeota archaeon]